MSQFVEDLEAANWLYLEVFRILVVFEDVYSAMMKFVNLLVNLLVNVLRIEDAGDTVAPGSIASRDTGCRFKLSICESDADTFFLN